MNLYLIIGNNINLKIYHFLDDALIVGIDRGCLHTMKSKINLDYAVGDFDSLSQEEFQIVKNTCPNVISLDPIKDVTDTYFAYQKFEAGKQNIFILGGIQGKRIEHLMALINLIRIDKRVIIEDDNSSISSLSSPYCSHIVKDDYRFYSFFAFEESVISLTGFRYELNHYDLKPTDSLCVSNEINDSEATIELHSGHLLMIKSRDDVDFKGVIV